jgi:ABC-type transport system involved in multi-copper enzyme maturation permease subunit
MLDVESFNGTKGHMVLNPIIHRELITLLRTPKALLIQLGYVAALILLVVGVWPDSATVNLGGRQAQQLFAVFVYGLLVALALIGPAFPAMAIVRERQQGTLRLLLTSPLTPFDILIGKISGAIGFIALLLVLSLPAAAACFAMGGIGLNDQFLPAYGILALTAVHYAMVALYVSSTAKSTDGALRFTYGYILLTAVIVLGPFYLVQGQSTIPPIMTQAAEWLAAVSPAPAVMQIIGHTDVGTRGIKVEADHVMRYVVWASAISVLCAIALLRQLQPHMMDRPRSKGFVTDEASKGVQIFRRFMYLGFFDPKKRTGSIADYENPVMMKEFRTRTFGRAHWMARIIGGCLVVSLILSFLAVVASMTVGMDYIAGVLVIFQVGLIILVTPALAAALISAEVESGGWVLLKTTPLSARRIIFGKLLSVGFTLFMILLATLPGYGILLMIDPNYTSRVIDGLISLGVTAVFALLLGAACSAIVPRTAAATTAAYLILVGLCVVTLLPWLGEGTLFGRSFVEASLAFNPLAASLNAVKMRAMADYDLIPRTWFFMGAATAVCAGVLWVKTWRLTRPQ